MVAQSIFINSARKVLDIEISALHCLKQTIDSSFVDACTLIQKSEGKVIVCGVGKSGHIASKIAATLASTGTPAFSLHPTEASHGDMGVVEPQDVVIAISYSGSSEELIAIIPALKRKQVAIIAITGNSDSPLAQAAAIQLTVAITQEACPHNLAPTASTTATLVLGDMLAIALLEAKGFSKDDFAASHPAGKLGKRLLIRVSDIMHKSIPLVVESTNVQDAILIMTRYTLGMVGVIDENGSLIGIFTDGDLRRTLGQEATRWRSMAIIDASTHKYVTVTADSLAIEALHTFEQKKINGMFVIDKKNKPIGAFNMHDLLQSGIV